MELIRSRKSGISHCPTYLLLDPFPSLARADAVLPPSQLELQPAERDVEGRRNAGPRDQSLARNRCIGRLWPRNPHYAVRSSSHPQVHLRPADRSPRLPDGKRPSRPKRWSISPATRLRLHRMLHRPDPTARTQPASSRQSTSRSRRSSTSPRSVAPRSPVSRTAWATLSSGRSLTPCSCRAGSRSPRWMDSLRRRRATTR